MLRSVLRTANMDSVELNYSHDPKAPRRRPRSNFEKFWRKKIMIMGQIDEHDNGNM